MTKLTPTDSRILTRLYGRATTPARQALRAAHEADVTLQSLDHRFAVRADRAARDRASVQPTAVRTRRTAHLASYAIDLGHCTVRVHVRDGQRGRIQYCDLPHELKRAGLATSDDHAPTGYRLTLAGAQLLAQAAQAAVHDSLHTLASAAVRAVRCRAWTAAADYAERTGDDGLIGYVADHAPGLAA